jgi:hypothetical protein
VKKVTIYKAIFRNLTKQIECVVQTRSKEKKLVIRSSRIPLIFRSQARASNFRLFSKKNMGKFSIEKRIYSFLFQSLITGCVKIFDSKKLIFTVKSWSLINLSGFQRKCVIVYVSKDEPHKKLHYEFIVQTLSRQDWVNRDFRLLENSATINGYASKDFEMFFTWLVANRLYT